MSEFNNIEQCADCIEATNTPAGGAYKTEIANRLRHSEVDLLGLGNVERDARRQLAACKRVRAIIAEQQLCPA